MSEIIVVGSGQAGYAFASEYRKLDSEANISLFTADDGFSYYKPALSNALAHAKSLEQLSGVTASAMADKLAMTVHAREELIGISAQDRRVQSRFGSYAYDTLVLAVGATQRKLSISGDAASDVLAVNSLDHYRLFRERISGATSVLVIGAGLIGCEFANDLLHVGVKPIIVDPSSGPLGNLVPPDLGNALRDRFAAAGAEWRFATTVHSVDAGEQGYRVTLGNGEVVFADAVLSAAGLLPNVSLAQNAGINVRRGIVIDDFGQTSLPGIFALGDCAEFNGAVLPFIRPIMIAAKAMASTVSGVPSRIVFPAMPVIVKTSRFPIVACPPRVGVEGSWSSYSEDNVAVHAFHDESGQLRGFAVGGDKAVFRSRQLGEQVVV